MTAHPALEALQADTLPPHVTAHLAECPRCRIDRRMLRDPVGAQDDAVRESLARAREDGATTAEERWAPAATGAPLDAIEGLLGAGQRVERYQVEALLGAGGMAVVYRVRHTRLNSLHALKVLTTANPAITRRLLQEGRVQSALRHPNVVTVTDVVDVHGAPGLVMEYVPGPSLDALLRGGPLDLASADRLAVQIIEGVAAAHAAGLVHRDLKPSNVLIDTTGGALVAKVADFGIAKLRADEAAGLTGSRVAMGSPAYMAPEQILDSKRVDERADLWALGACLYELVTGQRAFAGASSMTVFNRIVAARYVPPGSLVADLPERMERAIAACLQVDRDARVGSCRELLDLWTRERPPDGPWDTALLARARDLVPEIRLAPTNPRGPGLLARAAVPALLVLLAVAAVIAFLVTGAAAGWFARSTTLDRLPVPVVSDREPVQRQFELGWEQLMLGDLDGARRSLATVMEREPGEPYPVLLHAFADDLAGDLGSALALLDRKAHLEDGAKPGADLLRLYHRDLYPYPDNQGWDALLRDEPDDLLTVVLAARVASHAEPRLALFEQAVALDPEAWVVHLAWADALHAAREHDRERRELELVLVDGMVPAYATARLMTHFLDTDEAPRGFAFGDLALPTSTADVLPELTLRRAALSGATPPEGWTAGLPAVDRVRLLREEAELEFGWGRWSRARADSSECVRVARDAGLWSDALLCAETWVRLANVEGRLEPLEEAVATWRAVAAMPELPREQRARAGGLSLFLDGRVAGLRGDTEELAAVVKRLVALDHDRCGWTVCYDLQRALQAEQGEMLAWLGGRDCGSFLVGARIGSRADVMVDEPWAPYERLLAQELPARLGFRPCGFAGADRYAQAEAHIGLAELGRGHEHVTHFHRMWPAPDPDHPLVLRASAVDAE